LDFKFRRLTMKKTALFIFIGCMISSLVFGQTIYQWKDEKGNINFTDDISNVPEKYRDQVQERKAPKEPAPPAPVGTIKGSDADRRRTPPPEPAERKDTIGRGEDWWRGRAREWNDKLMDAQKNYDVTHATWKAKEKELADSVFKADYIKRNLRLEIKDLEEKTKEWERKRDEARHMLEKVIPKEAEEYKADPEWIRVR
jgi:hypothetical protein